MTDEKRVKRRRRPASSPEGRENQLIAMAIDYAEQQMLDGTAPAQVITHFLKLASSREKLEQARLENENLLLSAKIDHLASAKRMEELYDQAIKAMKRYSGNDEESADEMSESEFYD